jgi:hypothetical protein
MQNITKVIKTKDKCFTECLPRYYKSMEPSNLFSSQEETFSNAETRR